MTERMDLETRLGQFLVAEAPTDVPERLVHATRDLIGATRQRRSFVALGWRLGRAPAVAAIAGAVAVALVATVLLLPNRGGGSIASVPSPTPTAVAPSSSVSLSPSCPAESGTCLRAGSYSSTVFLPKVTYTVPDGWILTGDQVGELDLQYGRGGQYTYPDGLTFHDAMSIFRRPVAESNTSKVPLAGVGTKASNLAQWLATHPDLIASQPAPVSVGGGQGFRLVLRLPTGLRTAPDHCTTDHGEPRCESLFLSSDPAATYGFGLVGPEVAVVYLLDLPSGDTVMAVIDDTDGVDQPALQAAAQPIVESLAFGG